MTKTWHRRTVVASMFQNGISQNTECAKRDGFRGAGHILSCLSSSSIHLIEKSHNLCLLTPINFLQKVFNPHVHPILMVIKNMRQNGG